MTQDPIIVDRLYERVTASILDAERAEAAGDTSSARYAYLEVSFLEEDIARRLLATNPEGAIARRGAVTAALSAEQYERALDVLGLYLQEDLPQGLRQQLEVLHTKAFDRGGRKAHGRVEVRPSARFILVAQPSM